jgi:hypothetical protein
MPEINLIYDIITSPDTDKEFCVNSRITFGTDLTVQLPLIDICINTDNSEYNFYQIHQDHSNSGGIDPSQFINKMINDSATPNISFGRYMLCAVYHLNNFLVMVEKDTVHICNTTLRRTNILDCQLIAFFSMIRDKMEKMKNIRMSENNTDCIIQN